MKKECLNTLETQDKGDLWCVDSDWSKHMTGNEDKFLKNQIVPHGKSWRRKEDSKDIKENKISNIKEVSQYDEEFNSVVEKIGIHYDGNKDDEEVSDGGGIEDGFFF